MSSSQLTFIFFRGVQTTNQVNLEVQTNKQWCNQHMIHMIREPLGESDRPNWMIFFEILKLYENEEWFKFGWFIFENGRMDEFSRMVSRRNGVNSMNHSSSQGMERWWPVPVPAGGENVFSVVWLLRRMKSPTRCGQATNTWRIIPLIVTG